MDVPIQGGSMITGTYNNELQYPYGTSAPTTIGQSATGNSSPIIVSNGGGDEGGIILQYGGDGEAGIAVQYDGLFFETAKVSPTDIGIVNPATATNYDGYIVAIYLKCIGDTTIR